MLSIRWNYSGRVRSSDGAGEVWGADNGVTVQGLNITTMAGNWRSTEKVRLLSVALCLFSKSRVVVQMVMSVERVGAPSSDC